MKSMFKFLFVSLIAFSINASAAPIDVSPALQAQVVALVQSRGVDAVPGILAEVLEENGSDAAAVVMSIIVVAFPENKAQIVAAVQNSVNLSPVVKNQLVAISNNPATVVNVETVAVSATPATATGTGAPVASGAVANLGADASAESLSGGATSSDSFSATVTETLQQVGSSNAELGNLL